MDDNGCPDLCTLEQGNASNICQILQVDPKKGLQDWQVEQNRDIFGSNTYSKRQRVRLLTILKQAICNQLILILSSAAIVSVLVQYLSGDKTQIFWIDGVSIMTAVLICVLLSTVSTYKKQKKFQQLDQMTQSTYNYLVVREGVKKEIHRKEIVVGDLVVVVNGMEIPCDGIFTKSINIIVDQSAITGQSVEVYKDTLTNCLEERMDLRAPSPLAISGGNVVSGEGVFVAGVVGEKSQAGKSFKLIVEGEEQKEEEKTPMEEHLDKLASLLARIGFFAAIFILVVLVARLLIQEIPKGNFHIRNHLGDLIHYVIIAVTVIVVTIPEGLPLAVTITLAYSMKAMHKDKILVRKLQSCETMGAARYICSDKTGTITQNKMQVKNIISTQTLPEQSLMKQTFDENYLKLLTSGIFHNTSADVQLQKGSQTEIALLKLARDLTGQNQTDVRNSIGPKGYFKRIPFDSARKRMTTGLIFQGKPTLFMSGASEQLLQSCTKIHSFKDSKIEDLDQKTKEFLSEQLHRLASQGLRTMALCYKTLEGSISRSRSISKSVQKQKSEGSTRSIIQPIETSDFTLLSIFGIEDPPRPESKSAIQNCKKAGIKVIMVTGDNKITAKNIAEQVQILTSPLQKVIQASQLITHLQSNNLLSYDPSSNTKKILIKTQSDKILLSQIIRDLRVMARSRPQHKYILVDILDQLGHVVAVTGDGANDAPALMRADIGIAMGQTGTQISKNSADIIILDDRFDSILRAVVWGRNVYVAIRKFLQFQLTVNLIAICVTLISAAVVRQAVLTSVQLLWINLILDSVAVIALATEPPDVQKLLRQKPNTRDEPLVTRTMLKHIIGQSLFQLIILMALLFYGPLFLPEFPDSFDNQIGLDLQAKYLHGIPQSTVSDGKYYLNLSGRSYKEWIDRYGNYSRHFTIIFNTFVFMQIFNFICCRRIKDELNIFQNIFKMKEFWIVIFVLVVLQGLVVSFAGRFFEIYKYGLHPVQWVISVGVGMLVVPWSFVLRMIPLWKPEEQCQGQQQETNKSSKKKGQYEIIQE